MAADDASPLNPQAVAAVGAADGFVLVPAPGLSRALALQALAHATALAMANAAQVQGGMQQINNAASAAVIAQIIAAAGA